MAQTANPQLRSAVDDLITQVTPENILDVRRALLEEVMHLEKVIRMNELPSDYSTSPEPAGGRMGTPGGGFYIGRCSDDPISGPAQVSFNRKIEAVVQSCKDYVSDLNAAGETLAGIARQYSMADDEIERSFASVRLPW